MSVPVRTSCGWCKRLLSEGALLDGRESTGICLACKAIHFPARVAIPGSTPTTLLLPRHDSAPTGRPSSEGAAPSSGLEEAR